MRYVIHTETGSVHEVDDKLMTYARLKVGEANELRRDGEVIPLKAFVIGGPGEPCWFHLRLREDGISTMRTSSGVTSVEEYP